MLPSHTITVFTLASFQPGRSTDPDEEVAIGAATLTIKVVGGKVSFDLGTFILHPCEPAQNLLSWIDDRLCDDQATLSVYCPDHVASLLARLPGAEFSPGVRSLSGQGRQSIIRLLIEDKAGPLSFHRACALSGMASAPSSPAEKFALWCNGHIDKIAAELEIDAIGGWRMTIDAIEGNSALGRELAAVLRGHLSQWLSSTDRASARIHARDVHQTVA